MMTARGTPRSRANLSICSNSSGGTRVLIGTPVDGLPLATTSQYRIVPDGVTPPGR
jgi:hypothetical protein